MRVRADTFRALAGCSLLLGGCGGISRVDHSHSESAAGSSFGGAGSGGQSDAELAGGGSAGRAAAGGSLGDLPACVPFKDQPPEPVTVQIRNDTTSWIFLGPRTAACGNVPLFGVTTKLVFASQVLAVDQYEPATCRVACQGYFDGDGSDSCRGACAPQDVVRLGPGETVVSEWSGLADLDQYMPSECDAVSGSKYGVGCKVATREPAGGYAFHVDAGTSAVCADGSTGCTECVPDTRGGCRISGAIVTEYTLNGDAYFDLDARDGLTGPAGADNAGGVPVRTIEVVVSDAQ